MTPMSNEYEPPSSAALPAIRRAESMPERVLYVARAGLGALPSGLGTILVFMVPQVGSLGFVLWAIWWPYPATVRLYDRAIGCTGLVVALVLLVAWLLLRRHPGFLWAVVRAPFTRVTVTDRRVVWTVPWARAPVFEIGRNRITGGVLGDVNRRGRGNAAMALVPNDPAADIDGHIHFDRLPKAAQFVASLQR